MLEPGIFWTLLFFLDNIFQPALTKVSLIANELNGAIGEVNGTPKLVFEHIFTSNAENTSINPQIPVVPPTNININLIIAIGSYSLGITYDESAVKAIIIKVGPPIKPELTALSPITKAPTILTACPSAFGSLNPASLIISYIKWTSRDSVINENGVVATDDAILFKSCVGNTSGVNVPIATYNPGSKVAIKNDIYLSHLVNVAKYGLVS